MADLAECCGLMGDRSLLWLYALTTDEIRALVDEERREVPANGWVPWVAWGTRREHAAPPRSVVHLETLRDAFCGSGLRVVVEGCNRRWPRPAPTASLVCADCGRGRGLGSPPRGWPSGRRRSRWHSWFQRQGIHLSGLRVSSTAYNGFAGFRATLDGEHG